MPVCYMHGTPLGLFFQAGDCAMSDIVKCANCGFLAVRGVSDRLLRCANDRERRTGEYFEGSEFPVCGVGAFPLDREAPIHTAKAPARLAVIRLERTCPRFTKWEPVYSIKDHAEMLKEQAFLSWQQVQQEASRKFQSDESAKAHSRHIQSLIVSAVVAILAAAIGAGATLLAVKLADQSQQDVRIEPAIPPPAAK